MFQIQKMLSFLFAFIRAEEYPLLVSCKRGYQVQAPNQLGISGALGDKHVCFIIDRFAKPQIRTVRELGNFGGAMRVLERYGTMKSYAAIDSNEFDFLKSLRSIYQRKMNLDSSDECTCKADNYEEGLLVVRVSDEDEYVIQEILDKVPKDVTISFLASTDKLFKY